MSGSSTQSKRTAAVVLAAVLLAFVAIGPW